MREFGGGLIWGKRVVEWVRNRRTLGHTGGRMDGRTERRTGKTIAAQGARAAAANPALLEFSHFQGASGFALSLPLLITLSLVHDTFYLSGS